MSTKTDSVISYSTLFWLFLKIGCFAFGGFMSLVAVVENIVVREKRWLPQSVILDGISLASLMPGPLAVNVVAYIGYQLRGGWGAVVTATAVTLPAFFFMIILSYIYAQHSELTLLQTLFKGFLPAIAAIIVHVVWRMGKKNLTDWKSGTLALVGLCLLLLSPKSWHIYLTFVAILCFGCVGYLFFVAPKTENRFVTTNMSLSPIQLFLIGSVIAFLLLLSFLPLPLANDSLARLFVTFSGLSVMLFGGGYVFIPMIQETVVNTYSWVGEQAFIDCIAMGQVTPGPIVISVAFIGYQVKGILGALVATVAIFAPSAALLVIVSAIMDYLKQSPVAQGIMRAIRSGVIGMILYAAIIVLQFGIVGSTWQETAITLSIFIGALIALAKYQVNVLWIIPSAGLLGYFLYA